jgi:hypothetical protein
MGRFFRAIVRHDDGTEGETIATADDMVDLERAAYEAMRHRGLPRCELQDSHDGSQWGLLHTLRVE